MLDQVETEARPLALAADTRVGQPHLRHQVAAGELGQHLRVDPVGLARQRRQRPRPLRIGDPHIPPGQLELVVDKAGAVHRLNDRDDLAIAQSMHKLRKPIEIGRHRARVDERSIDAAGLPVEALAAEIESGVHTHLRDLLG